MGLASKAITWWRPSRPDRPPDEYRRAYENTYRFYKDKGQNEIEDEFPQAVRVGPAHRQSYVAARGERDGPTVSDEDLRKAIMQRTEFPERQLRPLSPIAACGSQSSHSRIVRSDGNGTFSPNKARLVIMDAVALTIGICRAQTWPHAKGNLIRPKLRSSGAECIRICCSKTTACPDGLLKSMKSKVPSNPQRTHVALGHPVPSNIASP